MTYEVVGSICELFPEQQITEKFKKREVVLEVQDGMYPQFVKIEFVQDKCSLLDDYSKNETVKIFFNLTGRSYVGKDGNTGYITSLRGWKMERQGDAPSSSSYTNDSSAPFSDDDVPF